MSQDNSHSTHHDFNITIPDDRLSSLISSLDKGDIPTIDSGLVRKNSLQSEYHKMDPLFKDRPTSAEQDICFPSLSSPPSLSSTRQQYYNKAALQLFRSHHLDSEKSHFNRTSEKRQSLYGDIHTLTQPIQEDTPRFVYYHSDTGRLEGKTLFDLCLDDTTPKSKLPTMEDLLSKENHWLDITSPTTAEMHAISRIFGIHPLTTEDIMNQEIREKCDSFRNYLFVCYRAFVHDDHLLRPTSFYNIVFKQHLLTIHFGKVPHVDYVQQRVEQLQAYITVVPDWINYAIIDEITDSFAPLIHQIEHEVESLDDMVLHSDTTCSDQTETVSRIGYCRKRVMQMLRLLSSKSDVIRALVKRFEERNASSVLMRDLSVQQPQQQEQQQQQQQIINHHHNHNHSHHTQNASYPTLIETYHPTQQKSSIDAPFTKSATVSPSSILSASPHQDLFTTPVSHHPKKGSYSQVTCTELEEDGRIFPDVGLYLGDVQDHILTMLQNLNHYETLLARTHTNYLAKISIELTKTSNSTNLVIGRLTIFATILLPMNLVTGLWGMNVKVPGGDFDNLSYFFWIVCSLAGFAVFALTLARKLNLF